jgi:hypothetical protein
MAASIIFHILSYREIERSLNVTSTSANKEREMIKEMNFIKESRPYIEEISIFKDEIYKLRQEKKEVGEGINELKETTKTLKE